MSADVSSIGRTAVDAKLVVTHKQRTYVTIESRRRSDPCKSFPSVLDRPRTQTPYIKGPLR